MPHLSQVSESVVALVANAAPLLTAIRVGQNRHVTGFLWHAELVVTTDQGLPAASAYTLVLANGALTPGRPGPRDPAHDLAAIWLDDPVQTVAPEPAPGTAAGALTLALGADFDGSPTVRLTVVHSFPLTAGGGSTVTLDLPGARVAQGGMVLDAEGRLLGMAAISPGGDAIIVPHAVIERFVTAATAAAAADPETPAPVQAGPSRASQQIPRVAVPAEISPLSPSPPRSAGGGGRRGWLGVSLQPITVPEGFVHRAGQPTARQVVSVSRGGPADRAGLRAGDVLLALDGTSTTGNHALRAFLAPERIGTRVEVRLMRDGAIHATTLVVAEQPDR